MYGTLHKNMCVYPGIPKTPVVIFENATITNALVFQKKSLHIVSK